MGKILSCLMFMLIMGSAFAQTEVLDRLKVQTSLMQTQMYVQYKKALVDGIALEEQRLAKGLQDWDEGQWSEFIDSYVDQSIASTLNDLDDEVKKPFLKNVGNKLKTTIKDFILSLRTMGRTQGSGAVITYLAGTGAGYAMVGIGLLVGAPGIVAFFSVFPLATIATSGYLAIQGVADNIEKRRAFNTDAEKDYYKEYKEIRKLVKKEMKTKKGSLIYVMDTDLGITIKKPGFWKSIAQFFGADRSSVSLINLKRSLKKHDLYLPEIKKIRKNRKLTVIERIVAILKFIRDNFTEKERNLVLARFQKSFIDYIPPVPRLSEYYVWSKNSMNVEDLSELPGIFSEVPEEAHYLSVMKLYQDVILPRLSEKLPGAKMRPFICLKRKSWHVVATGYKEIDLIWNEALHEDVEAYLQQCI
jgi:hypothetical protein